MSARQQKASRASTIKDAKLSAETTRAASGRSRLLYGIAALLSLFGLADAIYLTINHLTGETARCTVTSGCNEVLGSAYASIGGVPVAAAGALAYFAVFSLATLSLFGYGRARMLLALVVALMLLATLWLLFVQAFVLHKYCEYCLFSAAITLILSGIVVALRYKAKDEG
ncbi:MAG TPA: vitamin K epoxide reductase family protein [Pyrinomonadaceae bacterium]|jgi:uncharacterized membrane protein